MPGKWRSRSIPGVAIVLSSQSRPDCSPFIIKFATGILMKKLESGADHSRSSTVEVDTISIFLYKPPYRPTYKQCKFHTSTLIPAAATAYSVQRVVTGWTARGLNPGARREFSTRPNRPRGPPTLVYKGYHVLAGSKMAEERCWTPTSF